MQGLASILDQETKGESNKKTESLKMLLVEVNMITYTGNQKII